MQWEVMGRVFVLTGIIIIGYITKKRNVYSHDTVNGMSKVLTAITNPALIIGSTSAEMTGDVMQRAWIMLGLSLFFHVAVCLLLYPLGRLLRLEGKMRRIFVLLTGFGNVGFIGFPLALSLYGEVGLLYSIPVSVGFQVVFWTLGSVIFGGKKAFRWKNLVSPGTIASLYFILCMALPALRLPTLLLDVFELTGEITVPLALLLVGAMLAEAKLESVIKNRLSYLIALLKLLVLPLICYALLTLAGVDRIVTVLFTILMATPTGSLVPITANIHNCEPEYAAGATSLNTILFIATMPLILLVVM